MQTPFLDGGYSVFGQVIEGMDVAEKIAVGDKIQKIEISEATASLMPTPAPTAAPNPPVAAEGRPLAKLKLEERSGVYNAAPAVTIDPAKSYAATIETDKGNIVVELDPKTAPTTVNNFVLLSNLGFYDGMPVAHVQEGSYLVTGSPIKRPDSDVGYTLALEADARPPARSSRARSACTRPGSGHRRAHGQRQPVLHLVHARPPRAPSRSTSSAK